MLVDLLMVKVDMHKCILLLLSIVLAPAALAVDSLFDLSLEQLLQVQLTSTSISGDSQTDAASWVVRLDERQWRQRPARNALETLESQPATQLLPQLGGVDMLAIRGFTNTSSNRGVALLWDGVPLTDYVRGTSIGILTHVSLYPLSSIEFSQGAGSALHGSDAFHGVVAFNSYAPGESTAEAELVGGRRGYYQAGARARGELTDDWKYSLALSTNGRGDQQQGYSLRNPQTGQLEGYQRPASYDSMATVAQLANSEQADSHYQLGYYHVDYSADGFTGLGEGQWPAPDEGGLETGLNMLRGRWQQRLTEDAQLVLQVYHWQLDYQTWYNRSLVPAKGPVARLSQFYEQYRNGLQLQYLDELPLLRSDWALALGWDQQGMDKAESMLTGLDAAVISHRSDAFANDKREIVSQVLEVKTHLAESWQLHWGGRHDHYSDFGSQFSPRAGLIFQFAPTQRLKLLYSDAFRAPSAVEMGGSPGLVEPNPDLRPETLSTTELIWLRQASQSQTQLSLFRGHWRDVIVLATNPSSGLSLRGNQENSRNQGISASHHQQWQQWLLDLNGSWVKSHNESLQQDYGAFPRYILNLGLGYAIPSTNLDVYVQQRMMWQMDSEVAGRGSPPSGRLDNYSRIDLSARWQWQPQLELRLDIRNLLNRTNRLPGVSTLGGVEDEPLSFSLGVNYRF